MIEIGARSVSLTDGDATIVKELSNVRTSSVALAEEEGSTAEADND